MSLIVLKSGILDSLQDRGRFGHRGQGINPGGAMDVFSLQVANMLVGNDPGEAAIELHFPASAFLVTQPVLLALAGADFAPTINGEPIPLHRPILAGRNDVLQFQEPRRGARCYLALYGGFRVNGWLGSKSTHLRAHAGGWQGRALQLKDELPLQTIPPPGLQAGDKEWKYLPWQADPDWPDEIDAIGILPGPEWEQCTADAKEVITRSSFLLTHQSDRMGYRLDHPPLRRMVAEEMISTGVTTGTVQLLPDGKLIVLMADHQTTGGYPRVAQVISAHLPKLAQRRAGEAIRFQLTQEGKAVDLLLKQQQHLLQLQNACTFRLQPYLHAHHP